MKAAENITKNVMRRVYYAYALRLTVNRLTVHAALLFGAALVMTQFVHVAAVIENFKQVRVFQIDDFVITALTHTEVWTLLMLGVMGLLVVSYTRSLFGFGRRTHFGHHAAV